MRPGGERLAMTGRAVPAAKGGTEGEVRRGESFLKKPISKFFRPQTVDIAHFRQIKICGNLEDRNLNGA
jgi:hypothetical protein